MQQTWYTEGYLKLASAMMYLVVSRAAQSDGQASTIKAEIEVLRDCGKLIRQEKK